MIALLAALAVAAPFAGASATLGVRVGAVRDYSCLGDRSAFRPAVGLTVGGEGRWGARDQVSVGGELTLFHTYQGGPMRVNVAPIAVTAGWQAPFGARGWLGPHLAVGLPWLVTVTDGIDFALTARGLAEVDGWGVEVRAGLRQPIGYHVAWPTANVLGHVPLVDRR